MFKKLLSDTVIYGVSSILARIINYTLVPLHTAVLSVDNYGIISEFYAYAAFLNVVYTYGMETAYFRFSSKQDENPTTIFRLTFTLLLISTCLLSGSLYLFAENIATLLGDSQKAIYVRWFAILLAVDTLIIIPFAQLRLLGKAKQFALLKTFNIFLNVGLNYAFLLFPLFFSSILGFTDKVGYVFLANLVANLSWIPFFFTIFLRFRPLWVTEKVKNLLGYSLPILFSGIAFAVNEVADRLLLKYYLPDNFYPHLSTEGAIGVYSACYKLSIFISLAVQAYKFAAEPLFFAKSGEKNSTQYYADSLHYFILVLALMLLGVGANLDILAWTFLQNEVYYEGLAVVPYLLLANVALGIYYNLSVWYKVTDKTYWGSIIGAGAAVFTIIFNAALIPYYGYKGSAITTLIAYGSMAVSCYLTGQHYIKIPYRLEFSLTTLSFCFIVILFLPILFSKAWLRIVTGNAIVILTGICIYFLDVKKRISKT